jgi:uncharacterized protein (TIGR02996 family)
VITEAEFQAALDADPSDWVTRLVFADWLAEQRDPRAEGYRALGMNRRAPYPFTGGRVWTWLNRSLSKQYGNETRRAFAKVGAILPDDWFALLPRYREGSDCAAERRLRRLAENDAALAFASLPAARRAKLLATKPTGAPS